MKKQTIAIVSTLMVATLLVGCGKFAPTTNITTAPAATTMAAPAATTKKVTTAMTTKAADTNLTPIDGSKIIDGEYDVNVTSNSSMFTIVLAKLKVKAGKMTAVLSMTSASYGKLFLGTGAQALADKDNKSVAAVLVNSKSTFEIGVEALDKEFDCAAWSIKKSEWYDRKITVKSDKLPATAKKA